MAYNPTPNPQPVSQSGSWGFSLTNASVPVTQSGSWSLPSTTKPAISLAEQLDQIFAANCATVHLLVQALAALQGVSAIKEEADNLIGEFLDGRANTQNIMN